MWFFLESSFFSVAFSATPCDTAEVSKQNIKIFMNMACSKFMFIGFISSLKKIEYFNLTFFCYYLFNHLSHINKSRIIFHKFLFRSSNLNIDHFTKTNIHYLIQTSNYNHQTHLNIKKSQKPEPSTLSSNSSHNKQTKNFQYKPRKTPSALTPPTITTKSNKKRDC